jgi:colanic acid/amylovoran biosynthesis glycosyltransferase
VKVVYITAKIPFGSPETFILTELLALKKHSMNLLIIPRDKGGKVFHKDAESLIDDTLNIPWFNFRIFFALLEFIFMRPFQLINLLNTIFFRARNVKVGLKNLVILPKALYISSRLKEYSISHIHAHWASTTSTMAYVISTVTGIPWSFTAHRWDIRENNLLKEKTETASFVRVISEKGKRELLEIIQDASLADKIFVIHMGVVVPEYNLATVNRPDIFSFLCPANLLPVKGHKYLFEACKILLDKGVKFKCLIAGSGPLEDNLRNMVKSLELDNNVFFEGILSHEKLLNLYETVLINAVILPSIVTEDGQQEGIPVALMEAMSYGIPVISTNTGGISELIGVGSGIMIDEKKPEAIADAIDNLIKDSDYYNLVSQRGREKIGREFNISLISKKLISLFSGFL